MDKLFRQGVYKRYERSLEATQKDSIKTVLDVGCGPGHHTAAFLHQGKKVTALDIAEDMVNLTKEKVKKNKESIAHILLLIIWTTVLMKNLMQSALWDFLIMYLILSAF